MIFTYLPPNKNISKITDLMVIDETKNKNQGNKILEYFTSQIQKLENSLSSFVKIERMLPRIVTDEFNNEYILDDMLEYINFCICGERQKVILPNAPRTPCVFSIF